MANVSDADATKLAREQLTMFHGYVATIPPSYLKQLKRHIAVHPNDCEFSIQIQPKTGFGTILCRDCGNIQIKLERNVESADGGLSVGFGDLTAYQEHIITQGHMRARYKRMLAKESTARDPYKTSPIPSSSQRQGAPPARTGGILSRLNGISPGNSASSSSSPSVVPQKRPSGEPATTTLGTAQRALEDANKKAKIEDSPQKAPLGRVDANQSRSTDIQQRAQHLLRATQLSAEIATIRVSINIYIRKRSATARRSLAILQQRLLVLETEQKAITAALNNAPPVINKPIAAKVEPVPPVIPPVPQPTATIVKRDPYVAPVVPAPAPPPRVRSPSLPPIAGPSKLPTPATFAGDSLYAAMEEFAGPRYDSDDSDDEERAVMLRSHFGISGAPDHAGMDQFCLDACNEAFDKNATVDAALEALKLKDLGSYLDGMAITLLPHQIIGVAWMLKMEEKSQGGLLADEMGLGKTVQMIATMTQNQSDDPAVKTNLILAPVALLEQWKLEIESKTDDGLFSVLIYHGPKKLTSKKEIQKYDVVLTTYHTLMGEWPDYDNIVKRQKKKNTFIDDDLPKKKAKAGPLIGFPWYRIIIDEAQNIRNKNTRGSLCVAELQAKYRWLLTGTPIINSLGDAYPLLRFIRLRPWHDWREFRDHIHAYEKKNPGLASGRLQTILGACMLRRKKDTMLDGKPLITLPPKERHEDSLDFSPEERAIYNAVEDRTQIQFNRYLRAGTVLKNYAQVLVMLLRLRQICVHPCLLAEYADPFVAPGEVDEETKKEEKAVVISEIGRARNLVGEAFVVKMKEKLKQEALQRMEAEKKSADATLDDECPICYEPFTDAVVTACTHTFCRECADKILNEPSLEDINDPGAYKADERPCPSCRDPISRQRLFERKAFEPTDAELTNADSKSIDVDESDLEDIPPIPKKGKGKGRASKSGAKKTKRRIIHSDDSDDSMDDFIVNSDESEDEKDRKLAEKKASGKKTKKREVEENEEEDSDSSMDLDVGKKRRRGAKRPELMSRFLPSTKMKFMMAKLQEWASESPKEKTMVVSQWTSALDLCADYLEENDITYVRYDGRMSRAERDEAVKLYMTKERVKVLLMSLKAGGVGLNLTRGSRVISMDLGWSEAIENQAFDRLHRLGQTKPVHVHRLIVENSVEARVLALQARKRDLAEGSLGEGGGKKIGRLSVRELANLFGLDARGHRLQIGAA